MKSNNILFLLLPVLSVAVGCSSSSNSAPTCTAVQFSSAAFPNVGSRGANANVMSVTVNGGLCGSAAYQYANEPCTSVTVCSPTQPSSCQTINNILLDTGSYGLRIFANVLSVNVSPITSGGQNLAECVQFGDGSSEWGQVAYAYVGLGAEPLVATPILVINSGYATPPAACTSAQSTPDTDPTETGFNGILGVGLFAQDCGADCVSDVSNGQYFTCNGTDCSCGATVALAAQVQNPVALLPTDNNGVMLELPSVSSAAGVVSLSGNLYLGIGTQSNNMPSSVTTYSADANGNMTAVFGAYSANSMNSFIDSGSSGLFFPPPAGNQLPDCGSTYGAAWTGLYCPASVQSFSATNTGASGSPSGSVSFTIGNAYSLLSSSNMVFNNFGSNIGSSSAYFDWGLPFFYGRSVFVGIDGVSSSLGTGPLWAY